MNQDNNTDKNLTDEGYSEVRKADLPEFMSDWSDQQRADFALNILLTLPTNLMSGVTKKVAPLLHRDFIGDLPVEIATHILGFTDYDTLLQANMVNKKWKNICLDQSIWKKQFEKAGFEYNNKLVLAYLNNIDNQENVADANNDQNLNELDIDDIANGVSDDEINRFINRFGQLNVQNNNNNPILPSIDLINQNEMNEIPNMQLSAHPPSSPMTSQFRILNSGPSPIINRFSSDINIRQNIMNNLLSPGLINYEINNPLISPALSTPGLFSELQSPIFNNNTNNDVPGININNSQEMILSNIDSKFNKKIHYDPKNDIKMINWKYLYHQRKLINRNWQDGSYTLKYIPAHSEGIYCIQFDEDKIISGSRDNTIKIFDIKTGANLRTYYGHTGSVLCLQYKDNLLITGSSDSTIIIWELNTGRILHKLVDHTDSVLNLQFNDKYIVSCSKDRTIKIWDINTGKLVRTLIGHRVAVNAIQFHEDKIVSASGDRTILLWDFNTGQCLKAFIGHLRGIACLQFNGKIIISGSSDKTIKIWDVASGECIKTLIGHTNLVRSLQLKDNKLISGSYDHTIKVWDINTGKLLLDLQHAHQSRIFKLQFSLTKLVSCSQEQNILIWDFAHNVDTTFLV